MVGNRFSIVTFSATMSRWYADCVVKTGLEKRFSGVRCPTEPPKTVNDVASTMHGDLIRLVQDAIKLDNADVIILGGAPPAVLAQKISYKCPGILFDPISCANFNAKTLVNLSIFYENRTSRPGFKKSVGFSGKLSAAIAGQGL